MTFKAAFEIGARLADCGAIVVNGGGNSGLMHQTLEGAISRGGRVKGIITQRFIDQGEGHVQAFKGDQFSPALLRCPSTWGFPSSCVFFFRPQSRLRLHLYIRS